MKTDVHGRITIRLAYPVQTEAGELTEITLRRIRQSDVTPLMGIDNEDGAVAAMSTLLARLSGLSEEVIGEFDLQDWLTASTIAGKLVEEVAAVMPANAPRKPAKGGKARGLKIN